MALRLVQPTGLQRGCSGVGYMLSCLCGAPHGIACKHSALARAGVPSLQPHLPTTLQGGWLSTACCGFPPTRCVGVNPPSYRLALPAWTL